MELEVKELVENPNGKWADFLGNVITVDSKFVKDRVIRSILDNFKSFSSNTESISEDFRTFLNFFLNPSFEGLLWRALKELDINSYAMADHFVFKNRLSVYEDTHSIKKSLLNISNSFFKMIGKDYPSQISAPLEGALNGLFMMKNFLDNIFVVSVFLLTFHSFHLCDCDSWLLSRLVSIQP